MLKRTGRLNGVCCLTKTYDIHFDENRELVIKVNASNYINIYIWKLASMISGFLSVLIVVPHLSAQQELYGIYTFCMSFVLYLSYADLGFISAGQKFAGEEVAKGNKEKEMGITGFSLSLLICLFLPFSFFMFYLSTNTAVLFGGIVNNNITIASNLLLVMGLLLPVQVFLQRLVQFVLATRLKDYIHLRVDIVFNLVKIFSVYFFFKEGQYLIVEYFLFATFITITGSCIAIYITSVKIEYSFSQLMKSLRLRTEYFQLSKDLALSSFVLTLAFIVYYELDLLIIGWLFSIQDVALYAIGFTFLNFLRNLWNILYSPISQRLNHYSVYSSDVEISRILSKMVEYTLPLYLILALSLALFAEPLILFWVGSEYLSSVGIFQLLMISMFFGVISRPASYYFIARLKHKFIYAQALASIGVFCTSIFFLKDSFGMESLAIAKLMTAVVLGIIAVKGVFKVIPLYKILKKVLIPSIVATALFYAYLPNMVSNIFPAPYKDTANLVVFLSFLFVLIVFSYVLIIISNDSRRQDIKTALNYCVKWYKNQT